MTNHVHLLITPDEEQSLAKVIQMLGRYGKLKLAW